VFEITPSWKICCLPPLSSLAAAENCYKFSFFPIAQGNPRAEFLCAFKFNLLLLESIANCSEAKIPSLNTRILPQFPRTCIVQLMFPNLKEVFMAGGVPTCASVQAASAVLHRLVHREGSDASRRPTFEPSCIARLDSYRATSKV
jgi:hypothetical protein